MSAPTRSGPRAARSKQRPGRPVHAAPSRSRAHMSSRPAHWPRPRRPGSPAQWHRAATGNQTRQDPTIQQSPGCRSTPRAPARQTTAPAPFQQGLTCRIAGKSAKTDCTDRVKDSPWWCSATAARRTKGESYWPTRVRPSGRSVTGPRPRPLRRPRSRPWAPSRGGHRPRPRTRSSGSGAGGRSRPSRPWRSRRRSRSASRETGSHPR